MSKDFGLTANLGFTTNSYRLCKQGSKQPKNIVQSILVNDKVLQITSMTTLPGSDSDQINTALFTLKLGPYLS